MSRSHYWRKDAVQIIRDPSPWLAYPNPYSVTPERAEELKAGWGERRGAVNPDDSSGSSTRTAPPHVANAPDAEPQHRNAGKSVTPH